MPRPDKFAGGAVFLHGNGWKRPAVADAPDDSTSFGRPTIRRLGAGFSRVDQPLE